jgi:hypothetical protein
MKRSQTFINSIMLCFGAGVLLATVMLHILPEIRHGWRRLRIIGQNATLLHRLPMEKLQSAYSS